MAYSIRHPKPLPSGSPSKYNTTDTILLFEIYQTNSEGAQIDDSSNGSSSGSFSQAIGSVLYYDFDDNEIIYRSSLDSRLDLQTQRIQISNTNDYEVEYSFNEEQLPTFYLGDSLNPREATNIVKNLSDTEDFLSQNSTYSYTYETGDFGNDNIQGNSRHNFIFGELGNDILNGGDGNDTLNGGGGNDELIGGSGNDILNGYGGGIERDTLTGGSGEDKFILGAISDLSSDSYYDDDGSSGYALIEDYNRNEGDIIEVSGDTNDYTLSGWGIIGGGIGTYIYLNDDRIANVLDVGANEIELTSLTSNTSSITPSVLTT